MKCAECKEQFPSEILSSMFVGGRYTKPVCGVCALKLTNEIHGTKMTHFKGEIAQSLLSQAKKIKKRRKRKYNEHNRP